MLCLLSFPEFVGGRVLPGETAELHCELARMYSILYAHRPAQFMALKGGDRPFLGNGAATGMPPDGERLRADGPVGSSVQGPTNPAARAQQLERAIQHFREALKRKPDHLAAQLGLAWCLDQAKDKGAVEAYREALALAWKQEKDQSSILEIGWVEEVSGYLLALLDPAADKDEIERIKGYTTLAAQSSAAQCGGNDRPPGQVRLRPPSFRLCYLASPALAPGVALQFPTLFLPSQLDAAWKSTT
jgi:tetratricopeptide (TPR) repeat protein